MNDGMGRPTRGGHSMGERFIGAPLAPVASSLDTGRMAAGEPGLPGAFVCRDETHRVMRILRQWRETGPCRHGSGEQYVRKHWYEVEDERGRILKLYFERHPRNGARTARWHLFTMQDGHPQP
jgi:hypothetical protein